MNKILKSGRFIFAIGLIAFGIEHFGFGTGLSALMPVPAGISGRQFWIYFIGAALVIGGICIAIKSRLAAILLGLLFFIMVLVLHLSKIIAGSILGGEWTPGLEVLAFCGGALILAENLSLDLPDKNSWKGLKLGRYLFVIPLAMIGVQHFMFAQFVATLIPAWIPFRLFWAYFVGVAFITAAVSVILNIKAQLAAILLGTMFFLFFVLLHIPRVVAKLDAEPEWTSAFVALGMGGISLILADTISKKRQS